MDLVENVGRRSQVRGERGSFVQIGVKSLNGFEYNRLFHNQGDGRFVDVGYLVGADRMEDGRGVVILDVDADGRQDVVVQNFERPTAVLMNRSASAGNWLQLRLRGTRSNRDAIGARVVLEVGGRRLSREVSTSAGYVSGQSLRLHFGLGEAEAADRLVIHWPSGARTELRNVGANQRLSMIEPADGA